MFKMIRTYTPIEQTPQAGQRPLQPARLCLLLATALTTIFCSFSGGRVARIASSPQESTNAAQATTAVGALETTSALSESACTLAVMDAVTIYDSTGGTELGNLQTVGRTVPGTQLIVIQREDYGWYQVGDSSGNPLGWIWEGDLTASGIACDTFPQPTPPDQYYRTPIPDPNRCWFLPWAEGFGGEISSGPNPKDSVSLGQVEQQIYYEMLTKSEIFYEIRTESGLTGWMRAHGVLLGACDGLPFVQTRPDPPAGICAVYLDYAHDYAILREQPWFDSKSIVPAPAGQWMEVLARYGDGMYGRDWYHLRLEDGTEGWLDTAYPLSFGTRYGPCEDLPSMEMQDDGSHG